MPVDCPICGKTDQVQLVSTVVEQASFTARVGNRDAFSSSRLIKSLSLPPPPTQQRFSYSVPTCLLIIFLFGVTGGAVLIPLIAFEIWQRMQRRDRFMVERKAWQEQHVKDFEVWSTLCFCDRDQVVFIPGDLRGARKPADLMSLINSPPQLRMKPATPVTQPPVMPPPRTTIHVFLESAGDQPDMVARVLARTTGMSIEDASALIASAPVRVARFETAEDAERLQNVLEAVGATVSLSTEESAPAANAVLTTGSVCVVVDLAKLYKSPATDSPSRGSASRAMVLKVRDGSTPGWVSTELGFVQASDVEAIE